MEKISALMDGELDEHQARQQLTRLKQDEELLHCWHTFHLIGDAMRGDPMLRNDFTTRLRSRLQQEPTVLAPRYHWRKPMNLALSAAASLAAVAVVLTLVTLENPLQPLAPVAIAPKPAMTEGARAAAPPQPAATANQGRMNEYLMAHQEFSPSTALQGVAPYVRTVSVADGR